MRPTGWLAIAVVAVGCGKGEEVSLPPTHVATAAEVLEDAGDDVGQLCLMIDKHAGTPEAATALERVKARHARALAELPKRAVERAVQPKVAAALEAILRAATGKECDHAIGVSLDLTFSDSITRYASSSAGGDFGGVVKRTWPWDDRMNLAGVFDLALAELTDGYLTAVDLTGATDLTFALEVVADGQIEIGKVATMPGLAIEPTLTVRTPGAADETLTLDTLRIDPSGTIRYQSGGFDDAASAEYEALKQVTSMLASQIGVLPGRLGLAPVGEPALERFHGFELTRVKVVEDTCDNGGPRVGAEVMVSATKRELTIEFFTERATVAGDTLTATDTTRDPLCNTRDTDRWELTKKGGHLEGVYTSSWHDHEDCKKVCSLRVEVMAEQEP